MLCNIEKKCEYLLMILNFDYRLKSIDPEEKNIIMSLTFF